MECRFFPFLLSAGITINRCPFIGSCQKKNVHPENINPLIDCALAISEHLANSTQEVEPSPEELIRRHQNSQ